MEVLKVTQGTDELIEKVYFQLSNDTTSAVGLIRTVVTD